MDHFKDIGGFISSSSKHGVLYSDARLLPSRTGFLELDFLLGLQKYALQPPGTLFLSATIQDVWSYAWV